MAPTQKPREKRMTLAAVHSGKQQKPPRILVYGTEGIGKSTLASCAQNPIWIGAEDGVSELDVTSFPEPESWVDVFDAVETLTLEEHDRQTLVLDTLDWLEPLCWAHVCASGKKDSIEDFGYGKGYVKALDEWRSLLARLDKLRSLRGMTVVLLAHSWIKPFANPAGEDFDRYELRLNKAAAGLLKEWSDAVLFAAYEDFARKRDMGKAKGVSSGARVLHTQRSAAWDAKNRYSLPEQITLDWGELWSLIRSGESPDEVRRRINEELEALPDEVLKAKVLEAVTRAGTDSAELSRILNKLKGIKR